MYSGGVDHFKELHAILYNFPSNTNKQNGAPLQNVRSSTLRAAHSFPESVYLIAQAVSSLPTRTILGIGSIVQAKISTSGANFLVL